MASPTYSLQSVYQLPPSVATLCCSNFVPLPPDPPLLLLLLGRLKKKSIHHGLVRVPLGETCLKPRLRFSGRRTRSSDRRGRAFCSGVKTLRHWHGLARRARERALLLPTSFINSRALVTFTGARVNATVHAILQLLHPCLSLAHFVGSGLKKNTDVEKET